MMPGASSARGQSALLFITTLDSSSPDTKPVVNLDPHGRGECRYDAGSIIGPWAIGTALYYEKPDTKPVVYHPWSTGISVPDTKKEPLGSFRIDS